MCPKEKTQILAVSLLFALGTFAQQPEPAAIIVRPPAYSTALVSQTVRFTCVAYGFPTPESVDWSTASGRDLASLANDSSSSVKIAQQNVTVNGTALLVATLELCEISVEFTDEYTCSSDNGIGGQPVASSSASFFFTVLKPFEEPPAVILHPPASSTVDKGDSIELTCVAYGTPVPSLMWARHGCSSISNSTTENVLVFSEVVTVNGTVMRRSTLKICNAGEDDSGEYSCLAYNGVRGSGLAEAEVTFNILVAVSNSSGMSKEIMSTMEPSSSVSPATNDLTLPLIVILCVMIFITLLVTLSLFILGIYTIKNRPRSPKKEDRDNETVLQTEEEGEYQFDDLEDLIEDVDYPDKDRGIEKDMVLY